MNKIKNKNVINALGGRGVRAVGSVVQGINVSAYSYPPHSR